LPYRYIAILPIAPLLFRYESTTASKSSTTAQEEIQWSSTGANKANTAAQHQEKQQENMIDMSEAI
jgi:hypothetical protein